MGLGITEDRVYCETKYQTDTTEMYKCIKDKGMKEGGDYCYLTYFWADEYDKKYTCLKDQGVKNDTNYCVLKDKYLKE